MYIVGNAALATKVEMWKAVVNILKNRGQIGSELRLCCSRHKDKYLAVAKPADFERIAPEGGCMERCERPLGCGHVCELPCHAETRHKIVRCQKPCQKSHMGCGHRCPKVCWESCGKCSVLVKDVPLICGHQLPLSECWLSRSPDDARARCRVVVVRRLKGCQHDVEMMCSDNPDVFQCTKQCGGALMCRHQVCTNSCSTCTGLEPLLSVHARHAPCPQLCQEQFKTCSHQCSRTCHSSEDPNCGSCDERCELGCVHSQCPEKCGRDCVPCTEPCDWKCIHIGKCNMPCGAPCDRLPCDERCSQLLDCGHRCPSLCGEICPSSNFCQTCGPVSRRETLVGSIRFNKVNLDEDPVIFLPCQHFYTTSYLDERMEIQKAYIRNKNGQFAKTAAVERLLLHRKQCPQCSMQISKVYRYNRNIKQTMLDNIIRNIISRSGEQYVTVTRNLDAFGIELEKYRNNALQRLCPFFKSVRKSNSKSHNDEIIGNHMERFKKVKNEIKDFLQKADEERQFQVTTYKFSNTTRSRTGVNDPEMLWGLPFKISSLYMKYRLLGNILELRAETLQQTDMMQFVDRLSQLNGCEGKAVHFHQQMLHKCKRLRSIANKHRVECDDGKYYGLVVEIMLLQLKLIHLQLRPSIQTSSTRQHITQEGFEILSQCEVYIEKHTPCKRYESAVNRARDMLMSPSSFYDPVLPAERKSTLEGIESELRVIEHWYYCRNGHPVIRSIKRYLCF
jgi:hypothetical protein